MHEMNPRYELSQVALGERAPDTVITNGVVFNAHTGEFLDGQSIWVKDDMIAYVGTEVPSSLGEDTTVLDAEGMVVLPGLIEAHTHVINLTGIEEFVKYVIPGGVTTVITETIELATVVGRPGIEHLIRGLEGQPIRFYYTVAPLCSLTLAEEINALSNEEIRDYLRDPKCLGVGEIYWGNMLMEGPQGQRVRELADMAHRLGKRVEGHTAGARGRKLEAYTCYGVGSCHEPINEEEVLERLRLGYWVMIREGAIRRELEGVKGIFTKPIEHRRLILATDSMDPEGFVGEGYLDASLRNALALGVPPALAYQMVTLNAAEYFRLDHLIGSIAPGKLADLVMVPSKDEYSPKLVMCSGRVLFREGRTLVEPKKVSFPDFMFDTVKVNDYAIPPVPKDGKVRVMELVTRLVTKESIVDLSDPEVEKDVLMALALDRLGSGKAFTGLIKGFGLRGGACGTTISWDSGDIMVVGCDTGSMKTAVRRLRELGGGTVFAIGEAVAAEFPAPVCGVMTLSPMEVAADQIKRFEEALRENGVPWENPILTLNTLGAAAIPHFRLTHNGYVRLRDRTVLGVEV